MLKELQEGTVAPIRFQVKERKLKKKYMHFLKSQ